MSDYPFENHTAAFRLLIRVFEDHQVPYFLIGGQARDLLLSRMQIPAYALTKDIDFAVMVPNLGKFEQLRSTLLGLGFEPRTEAQYRLVWTDSNTIIDLLPFGDLAPEGVVSFPPPGLDVSVRGLQEVLPALEYVEIDPPHGIRMPVAPLHGIFLLKLIAWSERPEHRMKDLDDMERIIYHYWDFCEREVYDNERHYDLFEFEGEDADTQIWGARVLGRHLASMLSGSPRLADEVIGLIAKQAETRGQVGKLLLKFSRSLESDERDINLGKRMLDHIIAGMRDRPSED